MRAHWDQLDNLLQGVMTVTEVVTKFKRLLRLCPGATTIDQEKARRLIRAFCSYIVVHVDHNNYLPVNIEECYRATLQAEYHLKSTQHLPLIQP